MSESGEKINFGDIKKVPLFYSNPFKVKSEYANRVTITHTEKEFFISFWKMEPPMLMAEEDIETFEGVNVELVSKVVLAPELFEKLIKAFETDLEKFNDFKVKIENANK